ncbi:uncharacterized protein LOC105194686 [Solenopsis invicta]|uniref:uncharacterized protein LOC105194686 n=1 Tax=Solenopsis invicta TaxID=13686 RepID=UPI000595BDE7|nr:uncharacterized protein LOC105194686 [Solenopsis invicta]
MTPTFSWVFLLAMVGRAANVPRPLMTDACALLCNPGAATESERERDPAVFPRYPKVNCKLQSSSDEHQAWVIASHCLKLCNKELTIPSEVNCFALRTSLQANIGCYCDAFEPLSPNTIRLHESWRLNHLVEQLANHILDTFLISPLDTLILCDIHEELFKDVELTDGELVEKCRNKTTAVSEGTSTKKSRSVDQEKMTTDNEIETSESCEMKKDKDDVMKKKHWVSEEPNESTHMENANEENKTNKENTENKESKETEEEAIKCVENPSIPSKHTSETKEHSENEEQRLYNDPNVSTYEVIQRCKNLCAADPNHSICNCKTISYIPS